MQEIIRNKLFLTHEIWKGIKIIEIKLKLEEQCWCWWHISVNIVIFLSNFLVFSCRSESILYAYKTSYMKIENRKDLDFSKMLKNKGCQTLNMHAEIIFPNVWLTYVCRTQYSPMNRQNVTEQKYATVFILSIKILFILSL